MSWIMAFLAPVIKYLFKLPLWKVLAGGFVVAALAGSLWWEHGRRAAADHRVEELVILNDSTEARYARLKREKGTLEGLLAAEKEMGGKLVAGVKIVVKPETVYVASKPVPTEIKDSTRYATLLADTAGYKVEISATAPPFPESLRLGYKLTTPEFKPEVGFLKRGDDYYAIVSYGGTKFTTQDAFFTESHPRALSLWAGAEVTGGPHDSISTLQPRIYLGLKYKNPSLETMLKAGVGRRPYIGLSVEKKLF